VRALLLLWLLCHPALASSQGQPHPRSPATPPEKTEHHSGPTKGPQRNTDSVLPGGALVPPPAGQPHPDGDTEKGEQKSRTDLALAIFTGVLCLIGIGQLIVFSRQADRLQDSVDESRKATTTLRDNAVSQARAYITVGSVSVPQPDSWTRQPIYAVPQIINTGQTPAYDVAWAFRIEPHPPDFDPRPFLPLNHSDRGTRSRATIGSQKPLGPLVRGPVLQEAELAAIRQDTLRLYVYGTVGYRDAFKIVRYTNCCLFIAVDGENVTSQTTEYGNDADTT
jgi:hypothetical protein